MDERKARILIVDDNPEILEIIQILLEGEGYETTTVQDGTTAQQLLLEQDFDLIILDIMLPGMNGYQTCLNLRKISNVPVLFLSARGKDSDKTLGFSSGGDDYLTKPFSYSELVSRVKALIRRYHVYCGKKEQPAPRKSLKFHHLEIHEEEEEVFSNGKQLELTDTEYAILLLLVKNRHQLFSASRLYEAVWDEPYYYGANNTVMVHIRNLRQKIEPDPANPTLIKTVWGRGYRCD